jgi:uncharacterized protein (DUF2141 family)
MKKAIVLVSFLFLAACAFAAEYSVRIEIGSVAVPGNKVYVSVYDSEKNYNKTPFRSYVLDADQPSLTVTAQLPEGDYVVSAYQDRNGNAKLDTNLIGMPKEPVGISNYSGKGIPGGFNKLKLRVSADGQVFAVNLVQL